MRAYRVTGPGVCTQFASTQADAKVLLDDMKEQAGAGARDKRFTTEQVEVPLDKPRLLAFINVELSLASKAARSVQSTINGD